MVLLQTSRILQLGVLFLLCLNVSINCQSVVIRKILASETEYNDVNSPHNGHVAISNAPKFAVSVDLDYNITTKSAKQTVNMLLSLYSSKSMLSSGCIGFDSFSVAQHSARLKSYGTSVNYANFIAQGAYLNLSLWLDYTHWNLSAESILGSNCFSNEVSFARKGLWGMLGLGFKGDSIRNFFGGEPHFSIFIEQDGTKGELSFVNDPEKTSSPPNVSLSATADWRVLDVKRIGFSKSVINSMGYAIDGSYNLAFDLNSDAMGLPKPLFESMMETIQKFEGIKSCTNDIFRPSCKISSNKVSDFPTIRIIAGKSLISLGPETYIFDAFEIGQKSVNSVVLNIKAISSKGAGKNYAAPDFENTIILDSQVMRNFYTVFSGNSIEKTGTISLYPVKIDLKEIKESFFTAGFIIKCVIALVIISVLTFAIKSYIRKRAESNDENISYQDPVAISLVIKRKPRLSTKGRLSIKTQPLVES